MAATLRGYATRLHPPPTPNARPFPAPPSPSGRFVATPPLPPTPPSTPPSRASTPSLPPPAHACTASQPSCHALKTACCGWFASILASSTWTPRTSRCASSTSRCTSPGCNHHPHGPTGAPSRQRRPDHGGNRSGYAFAGHSAAGLQAGASSRRHAACGPGGRAAGAHV